MAQRDWWGLTRQAFSWRNRAQRRDGGAVGEHAHWDRGLDRGSVWHWGAEPFLPQVLDSDEKSHHQAVTEAMRVIGFSPEEVASVHRILAAILHLVSLAVGSAAISPCGALAGRLPWRRRPASDNPAM